MAEATRDGIAVHNGGGEVFLISGRFGFSGQHAALLFDALPPIINIPKASPRAFCAGRSNSGRMNCVTRSSAVR